MNKELIKSLANKVIKGESILYDEALQLIQIDDDENILFLLESANTIRKQVVGNKVDLCSIMNVKLEKLNI